MPVLFAWLSIAAAWANDAAPAPRPPPARPRNTTGYMIPVTVIECGPYPQSFGWSADSQSDAHACPAAPDDEVGHEKPARDRADAKPAAAQRATGQTKVIVASPAAAPKRTDNVIVGGAVYSATGAFLRCEDGGTTCAHD
jgi:hypothetical protein